MQRQQMRCSEERAEQRGEGEGEANRRRRAERERADGFAIRLL